jgi:hypothetical protein
VLTQLHSKKAGVEKALKKNQSDLKTLSQTIESISDGKYDLKYIQFSLNKQ